MAFSNTFRSLGLSGIIGLAAPLGGLSCSWQPPPTTPSQCDDEDSRGLFDIGKNIYMSTRHPSDQERLNVLLTRFDGYDERGYFDPTKRDRKFTKSEYQAVVSLGRLRFFNEAERNALARFFGGCGREISYTALMPRCTNSSRAEQSALMDKGTLKIVARNLDRNVKGYLDDSDVREAVANGDMRRLSQEAALKVTDFMFDTPFECRSSDSLFYDYNRLHYFKGFHPSDPSTPIFFSLPAERRRELGRFLQERDRDAGPVTPQDGYELTRANMPTALVPRSGESWKSAKSYFIKTSEKNGYSYLEVNFQNDSSPGYSDPEAAFTPDFEVIVSYESLKQRKDFPALLSRSGLQAQMALNAGTGEPVTVYTSSSVVLPTLFAFLQIQKEAFLSDIVKNESQNVRERLRKALEDKKLIPLHHWKFKPYEGLVLMQFFHLQTGKMSWIGVKTSLREQGIVVDHEDLFRKLEELAPPTAASL